jgi:hypothetical protein
MNLIEEAKACGIEVRPEDVEKWVQLVQRIDRESMAVARATLQTGYYLEYNVRRPFFTFAAVTQLAQSSQREVLVQLRNDLVAQLLAACTQERERSQLARRLGSRLTVVKRMVVATDKGTRFCYGDVREAAPSTNNAHLADTAARALQTLSQLLL